MTTLKGTGIGPVAVRKAMEQARQRGLIRCNAGRISEALEPFAYWLPCSHQAGYIGKRAKTTFALFAPEAWVVAAQNALKASKKLTTAELRTAVIPEILLIDLDARLERTGS